MNPKNQKKSPLFLPLSIVVVGSLITMADAISEDAMLTVLGFVVLLLPAAVIFLVARTVIKTRPATHTHDRIDHSRDLQINPQTGKTIPQPASAPAHSPREHWLQQLDALYKNGTIDANEYRAMRERKF